MATLFDVRDPHYQVAGMHQAHAAVSRGEVIVVPTDTVYGVAVCPKVPGSIDKVVAVKGRSKDMAPPILVTGVDQASQLVAEGAINDQVGQLLHHYWPGALTVVLPVKPDLGFDIGHTPGTIALRSPDHPILLELLRLHGPLAVTSANLTGQPPCRDAFEAINVFGDAISVYLNAGEVSDTGFVPSTIVDASALVEGSGGLRIIRQGAISVEHLQQAGFDVEQS